jgi:hypothetical protein
MAIGGKANQITSLDRDTRHRRLGGWRRGALDHANDLIDDNWYL